MTTTIVQGDSLNRQWTFSGVNGLPVDLTGCTASFGILTILGVSVFQAASTDGSGHLTIPEPTTGALVLAVPPSITAGWAVPSNGVNVCRSAVKIKYTDGSAQTYDIENMTIIREVAGV